MRKLNSWKALVSVTILWMGLGFIASPGQVVRAVTAISQIGSDIDGEDPGDGSGNSVAMSADGTRVAIGATQSANGPGYVRIYTWNGTAWQQTGTDINGTATGDQLGYSVAMSTDGTRVAIGATQSANGPGYVRIFTLNGTAWQQTGADIIGEVAGDESGGSVAMSADGTRVAIGASSNGGGRGHVRVYTLIGNTWTPTGLDIDGEAAEDFSGYSVAMSADGTRVAIGAHENDGTDREAGHVRIYTLIGNTWTPTGLDIDGEDEEDFSGYSVALSADGTRVAVGAPNNDGSFSNAGHVRIYTWNGSTWTQTGSDINGEATNDYSGYSVALSADGTRVAIGAPNNDGSFSNAGHVRIYTWNGSTWTQTGTDIDGEAAGDRSGYSVAMSSDGTRVSVGAINNDNVSGIDTGHVRVYALQNSPSAPTISSVTAADGSLAVSFTAGSDGGSPITNYKYSIDGTNYVALSPATPTSPFTISGLTNGTAYSVTIKAVNGVGDSPASNAITETPVAPAPVAAAAAPTTTVPPAVTTTTLAPAATTTTVVAVITASAQKVVETKNELPVTGSNSSPLIAVATILLSVGLVVITRRRITS